MKIFRYSALFIFALVLTACSAASTSTPTLTPQATPTPTASATVTLAETSTPVAAKPQLNQVTALELPVTSIDVARSNDGKHLFVMEDGVLRVLDGEDYRELDSIKIADAEYTYLNRVILSPTNKFVVTWRMFGFNIWHTDTLAEAASGGGMYGAGDPVFSSDDHYAVYVTVDGSTGGRYESICRIDLTLIEDGETCFPFINIYRSQFFSQPEISPDGRLVAAGYHDSTQNFLYIWDLESLAIVHEIKNQPAPINSLAFSPDGSLLATGGEDGIIRLWEPNRGVVVRSIAAFSNSIESLQFSEDGKALVVDVPNQASRIYDLDRAVLSSLPVTEAKLDPYISLQLEAGTFLSAQKGLLQRSPDGSLLAVGLGSIQVLDAASHQIKAILYGNESFDLAAMTFSADGNRLAALTEKGVVYIWDVNTGERLLFLPKDTLLENQPLPSSDPTQWVLNKREFFINAVSVAFTPDGRQVMLPNGHAVQLWDVESGKIVRNFESLAAAYTPGKVSISPDGTRAYAAINNNQALAVWDALSGDLLALQHLTSSPLWVSSTTALQANWFAYNNRDESQNWIELWNIENHTAIQLGANTYAYEMLQFSAGGKYLIAKTGDNKIAFLRVENAQLLHLSTNEMKADSWVFDAQNNLLVTLEDQTLTFWDAGSIISQPMKNNEGNTPSVATVTPTPAPTMQPTQVVNLLPLPTLHPQGISASSAGNLALAAELSRGSINNLAWAADGKAITVTSGQGVYQLNPRTLALEESWLPQALLAGSSRNLPDGRVLLAGTTPDGRVQLWEMTSATLLADLPGDAPLAISPDGKWLLLRKGLNTLHIWNIAENKAGVDLAGYRNLYDYNESAFTLPTFSPDSRTIAIAYHDTIRVWDVQSGTIISSMGGCQSNITDLSFSNDGNFIVGACGGGAWLWSINPGVPAWQLELFAPTYDGNLTLFDQKVTATALSKDGKLLAVGTTEKQVLLYDRNSMQNIGKFEGLASPPAKLAFSPNSSLLLMADQDGGLTLWDIPGKFVQAQSSQFSGRVYGQVAHPDGSISLWLQNTLWRFNPAQPETMTQTTIDAQQIFAINPAGDLVAAYTPPHISLFDAGTGALLVTLPEEPSTDGYIEYYWEGLIFREFYGATFSADGTRLFTYGFGGFWEYLLPNVDLVQAYPDICVQDIQISADSELLLYPDQFNYNLPTLIDFFNVKSEEFYFDGVTANVISPDKRWIAFATSLNNDAVNALLLVDAQTWAIAWRYDFEGDIPTALAFDPTGTLLAVGMQSGEVLLLDLETFSVAGRFNAHQTAITSIGFSVDGSSLVTAAKDGIRLWQVKAEQP